MSLYRGWGVILFMLCCFAMIAAWGSSRAQAQDAMLDEETAFEQAARAVVRIRACHADICEIGTGVIIDPNGIILTAWHVAARDPASPDSAFHQNVEIQISDDVASPPQTRYRAQVIAAKADQDLALLRITYDVQSGRSVTPGFGLDLPWLPLSAQTPRTAQLRIMGYPPLSDTLSYPTFDQSGLEEGGALLRVQNPLSRGFSGGPALLRRTDGAFEIVGLVIRRRGEDVGLIRNIRLLQALKWQRNAQRAWAENIEVHYDLDGLQVRLDLHTLDLAGRQVQVRILLSDATTNQPWSTASTSLPTTDSGQVFFDRTIQIQHFAEVQRGITLAASLVELGVEPDRLRFRVTLWDGQGAINFWQSPQAHAALRTDAAMAVAPTVSSAANFTPTPTVTAAPTITPDPLATAAALQTAVEAAINATLTVLAPTATPTPNFEEVLATAVAATLAAQPTATAHATHTPTIAPTPIPTATSCAISVDADLGTYWSPDLGCALGHANVVWASFSPYERGMMMWRDDTKMIYGFFNGKGWQALPDRFTEGMPEKPSPDRGEPPPGLLHPIRGTGLVWATNDTFFQNLGWLRVRSIGFCAKVQNYAHGAIWRESGQSTCSNTLGQPRHSDSASPEFEFRFVKMYNSGQWSR